MEGGAELKETQRRISLWEGLQRGDIAMHMGFKVGKFVWIVAQERSKVFFESSGGLRRLKKRSDRVGGKKFLGP